MTYRLPALNTLRAFEAAARNLSFKTAASELGVTAGAVSQQVKKLEASLGVDLFRRLPHGLLLTEEGETYLPLIAQAFEDITDATEAISPKINSKKFTVGICPRVQSELPKNWPNYKEALNLVVRDTVATSDIQLIHENEIDCLIRLGGGPYGKLALKTIQIGIEENGNGKEIHFLCKTGLADCRQSKVIFKALTDHFAKIS